MSNDREVVEIPYSFPVDSNTAILTEKYSKVEDGVVTEDRYKVAGRLMLLRSQGKISFGDLRDQFGSIQLFVRSNEVEEFDLFNSLNLGDWIGVEGRVGKTKKGELSIFVDSFTLLARAERNFGDKWHGVTDTDTRYRQRYVDLWANPASRETFAKRFRMISLMRRFL